MVFTVYRKQLHFTVEPMEAGQILDVGMSHCESVCMYLYEEAVISPITCMHDRPSASCNVCYAKFSIHLISQHHLVPGRIIFCPRLPASITISLSLLVVAIEIESRYLAPARIVFKSLRHDR